MELFDKAYNQDTYLDFLAKKFNFSSFLTPITIDNEEIERFEQLGFISTHDGKQLPVFEIHIKSGTQLGRNRVQLRNLVAKEIQTEDGALAVYVDEPSEQWRFSFIAIEYTLTEGGVTKEQTASKRFTYLLGENTQTRTAKDRFGQLNKQSTLGNLKEAFAVEPLNKEFYDKLYKWYEQAQKAQTQVIFPNDEQAENHTQTSLIRLLTRLLFIWFIKEKKLVNADLFDKDKLLTLIDWQKHSSFYKAILQNLFFATLNRPVTKRSFRTTTNGTANETNYLVTNIYRYQKYFTNTNKGDIIDLFKQTPFLNGGLFECLDREASDAEKQVYDNDSSIRPVRSAIRVDGFSDRDDNKLEFDNSLFFNDEDSGLIDLFNQYQFTVEESTPLDIEVALDPELLGKVFENLLASYNPETGQQARKATGSFYTPREIVSYMVDESLKAYLLEKAPPHDGNSEFYKERLQDLISISDKYGKLPVQDDALLYPEEIPKLIKAISTIKIIDPAVGSGAFPMGILQRLVALLRVLDPGNTHWKQQQLDIADKLPDPISREQTLANIESIFSPQNAHNDYGRKLYLIENSIYGVDIQPIAIQICKLRFFISLTIEQNPNQDESDNYGIKALPNLETRFIVANSLLPVGETPEQSGIFDTNIEKLQRELAEVRHRHFSAKTLKTKRKCRDEDKDLREQMLTELTQSGITPEVEESMQKIVSWDLYNQNAVADWFDPEWMFGVKEGFDIVIGNPPYIQLQKDGGRLGNLYQNCDFKTFARAGDIYQLFYEKGLALLKETQGVQAFITSNSWMRAKYGEKLRRFFSMEHTPLRLIDIGKDAFTAIVDTNILLVRKGNTEQIFKAVDMDSLPEKQFPPAEQYWSQIHPSGDTAWSILSPAAQKIRAKIETIGTPLKEWDIRICRGVLTGFNEAFIIDTSKRDELIAQDPKSAEIIKPVLRGRDIGCYQANWAGKWLIYSNTSVKENDFPAIRQHLLQYKNKLLARTGGANPKTGKVPYKWWQLQVDYYNSGTYKQFAKEKLIWMHMSGESRFAYSNGELYCNNKCFIITGGQLKYLGAMLNSKLVSWFMGVVGVPTGMGLIQWDKFTVETIPCIQLPKRAQQPFIRLVDKILTAKQNNTNTTALEAEIDQMVYKLYNLTKDEIDIIEAKK